VQNSYTVIIGRFVQATQSKIAQIAVFNCTFSLYNFTKSSSTADT